MRGFLDPRVVNESKIRLNKYLLLLCAVSVDESVSTGISDARLMRRIHLVDRAAGSTLVQARGHNRKVLGSWKEIAAYLGKGVRTVQRWENDLGLPVRRPNGTTKGVVYASPDELDRWLNLQWARRVTPAKHDGALKDFSTAVMSSRELRRANRQLVDELLRNLQGLRDQCAALVQASGHARESRRLLGQPGGALWKGPRHVRGG